MSNRIFLLAWDERGLETVLDLTDTEYNIMWDEIKRSEENDFNPSRANLNKILSVLRARAVANKNSNYEIYIIQATDVTERNLWDMFITDLEGSINSTREHGVMFYSERAISPI